MYCKKCGAAIDDDAVACPKCGSLTGVNGGAQPGASEKSRLVAFLLCFFFGGLGVHRFYVGKIGTAVAMLFTLGGLGIWTFIDWIMILAGKFTDKEGRILANW
ncbi:TM2 domain-containing protein [Barnesiella sp. An55]|uniref:zinc-ribbon domain and TM2 domain-containing protein n=1 Tax=Barnesiella sp. An55 TaxID=1965646 RepID=UPI000B37323E|nr:TM2 domain-containing protein [Barnesiella sp. An55]OUN71175.1 hypothetical protein B5G10_09480 [Barnesiella sp. An55]HIZ26165.1 TM2 domain-containing protein [Candidatus Barnesiella merdipullorum]